jgi:hypothetical protein
MVFRVDEQRPIAAVRNLVIDVSRRRQHLGDLSQAAFAERLPRQLGFSRETPDFQAIPTVISPGGSHAYGWRPMPFRSPEHYSRSTESCDVTDPRLFLG